MASTSISPLLDVLDGGDGVSLESRSSVLDTESSLFAALNGDPDFFEVALTLSFNGAFGFTLIDVFLEVLFGTGDGDEFLNQMHFLHAVVYSSGWGSSRLPCDDPPTTALGPAANLAMPHVYPPELCLWRYCWCNLPDHTSPIQNGNDYSIVTSQLVHYVQEPRVDHVTDDSWHSAYKSFDSHEIDL